MAITPLPTPPNRGMDPDEFVEAADAFLGALPLFAIQVQNLIDDIDPPDMTTFGRSLVAVANAAAAQILFELVPGTNVQAFSSKLQGIANTVLSADTLLYATGAATFDTTSFTALARTLLGGATADSMRGTLGLGSAAVKYTGTSGDTVGLLNGNNTHSGNNTFSGTVENAAGGSFLSHASHGSGVVTISTDDPEESSGADGDIWLKVEA